jgi:Tfp pilus tip-associated adhesin PilY1
VADFDHNGFLDIFVGTDGVYDGNPDARMWIMRNQGLGDDGELQFDFECFNDCEPLSLFYDVDMSAVVDYDSDGDMDVILADANHSGDYYLIINQLAQVYALHGEAISTNVSPDLNPNTQAITKVRVNALDQYVRGGSSGGLTVTLYVSNNGGKDWEFVEEFEGSEIAEYSTQEWHYFTHFGSMLKWKAVLTAEEDEMEEFTGASYETPVLTNLELEYAVVERREYSRTSVAAELIDEEDQPVKLIIGGSFYFPGWQGHLRAYDVTDMTSVSSSYSELTTISRPDLDSESGREIVAEGVTIKWDAGVLLDERSPSDRNIYTALKEGESLTRYDFTASNVESLKEILNDQQNDHEGLINFIRGEGRDWKLGDINHSNPAVVGPPNNDASVMGSGYSTFAEDWSDREKVLFVGANDGMIHCFRVLDGVELWGYIPYNLLPKLRNMRPVDEATDERYFLRDVYVDGSPVVEDVYINGEWKTVLICGQGRGKGSAIGEGATGNYYFALDITDIEDPQPLWEFTDEQMGETWSVPVIGRITKEGQDTWAAFMGSGYDNVEGQGTQGNRFYAVDIASGEKFYSFDAEPEIDTQGVWSNSKNVVRTMPGSPGIIDTNNDGYADAVYIGDLDGRMWKVDVSVEFLDSDPWAAEELYEDPHNYPIITKPAVWIQPGTPGAVPRIYFGTGGDDKAPNDAVYSFIALIDGEDPEVEWYLGDPDILGLSVDDDRGDLSAGEKVWADPKIANKVVYFSTLTGNIETVDPCESLAGIGRLYARYVDTLVGTPVGSTAFRTETGQVENLELAIKTRAAVTVGETTQAGGIRKKEVYIQEYDSTLQKLEQPAGPMLKVKSWREIFKIIK